MASSPVFLQQPVAGTTSHDEAQIFSEILPTTEKYASFAFRNVRDPDTREERMQEARGLAWRWTVALCRRGKDPRQFKATLAHFAARAVKAGRRVCGQRMRDIFSPQLQQREGFRVVSLPGARRSHEDLYSRPRGQRRQDVLEEHLADNTRTPVPDQVAFRLDFRAWLRTLTDRDRRMIERMIQGDATFIIAGVFGTSPSRISQLRRQYLACWRLFIGDNPESPPATAPQQSARE